MFHPDIVCCYLYIITKYGYPPPGGDTMAHLRQISALGFRSMELEGIRRTHLMEVHRQREQIRQAAEELEMNIPVFCIVLPGLSAPDPETRKINLGLFDKGCEVAAAIGASAVLDNAPLPPYTFPEDIPVVRHYDEDILSQVSFPEDLNWKKYWVDMTETYREACKIAANYNLNYHMHPCLGVMASTTDAWLHFADAVNMDNLRFNLDTANQFFMKDNLYLSLIRLKDRIDYLHISDNRGKKVEHLVPGKGNINWDRFFETLDRIGYKGLFGIDVGGAETAIRGLKAAYLSSAKWLEDQWFNK